MTLEAAPDRNLGHADRKLSTQQSLFIPTFFFFFKKQALSSLLLALNS